MMMSDTARTVAAPVGMRCPLYGYVAVPASSAIDMINTPRYLCVDAGNLGRRYEYILYMEHALNGGVDIELVDGISHRFSKELTVFVVAA